MRSTLALLGLAAFLGFAATAAAQDDPEPRPERVHPPGVETTEDWYAFEERYAQRLAEQGRFDEVVEEYIAGARLEPTELDMLADACVLLVDNAARLPGGLARDSQTYRVVERLLKMAVPRGGLGDKRLAYAIGRLRFVDNNWPRAWEMFREAYADGEGHDPERTKRWFYRATVNRSDLLVRAFRIDEAMEALHAVIADSPPDADWLLAAKLNLAAAHRRLDEKDKAEAMLREMVQEHPDSPQPWDKLGQVLYEQNKLPEALDAFERAIALAKIDGQPYHETEIDVARTLFKLERHDEAEERVRSYLAMQGDAADGLYLLASVKRAQGDTMEAIRILRRSRRINGDGTLVLKLLQRCHYDRGEDELGAAVGRDLEELRKRNAEESGDSAAGDGDTDDDTDDDTGSDEPDDGDDDAPPPAPPRDGG